MRKRFTRLRGANALSALVVLFFAAALPSQAAEYRLAAGDVVEISVVGLADMRQRSPVDLDGNVSLPLVGTLPAAGTSIAQLRGRVQEAIARKVVRRRTEDGREFPVVIEPDEVTLTVVEFRPVYVNGDVSKPGEVPFRPEMTVRQAVTLAGGYDVMRFRINNPFLQAADLESELRALAAEHTRDQARIARLQAELTKQEVADQSAPPGLPVTPALVTQIRTLENEQFKTRNADLAKERTSLQTLIRLGEAQLTTLNAQREREEEGEKVDAADLQRLTALFDRGNLAITRVTETRRSLLLSATRLLQTNVQIERVRREREGDLRRLQKLDDERRLQVARDLQDAHVQLASTRAKIDAANEKLLYTATVRSQLVRGTGGRPDIVVVRRQEDGRRQSARADEDAVLLPGDVVEVSLVSEYKPGGANPLQQSSRTGQR